MEQEFKLENHSVHLWRVMLPSFFPQEEIYRALLSVDELERADRFHFVQHRQRFVIARAILREILNRYSGISPGDIQFIYGRRGKPYLATNPLDLQFNVSHSHDVAVYIVTIKHEVGIDIEKIESKYNDLVAKRFFSEREYVELSKLNEQERCIAFYRIWASKEALIKALGEGLYASLTDFSIDLQAPIQSVLLNDLKKEPFHLEQIFAYSGYQAAFATNQTIVKKDYWEWTLQGPHVWHF